MSWFSSSSSASASPANPPTPAQSQDGGFIAPDRTARAVCWEGRDLFFACLEQHGIIDSVREDKQARAACAKELKAFESSCASSWVTYFKKRRVMEYQRDQTLKKLNAESARPMDTAAAASLKGTQ